MATTSELFMLRASALMMAPMLVGLFPKPTDSVTVRITAGQHDVFKFGGVNHIGGPVPNVALFDANGGRIRSQSGQKQGMMRSGEGVDIEIKPYESGNKNDPEYITISASDHDAICIAAVTVAGANTSGKCESPIWGWNGVFARTCGQKWYSPKKIIGTADEDIRARKPHQHFYKDTNEPQCPPIFKELPEADKTTGREDPKKVFVNGVTMCGPKIGETSSNSEVLKLRKYKPRGRKGMQPTYRLKRSLSTELEGTSQPQLQRRMGYESSHAVIVNKVEDAASVRQDENSEGPDYPRRERYLRDMCTRDLVPFCSENVTSNCFDKIAKAIRGRTSKRNGDLSSVKVRKRYDGLDSWDG
ncbi:hypothetical protein AJ79_02581 [Helicocarpus griseus UAMH5409]|uniref:Uncharacterized protein n=1 Tax=Helicocarpus griseus UAMH5409 TaxID=1447875 RepID=A0A2B7Y176_9EURO|nr:hypothetical protein AJ79_02581 [Helicocarpus griseus UAMH5409]